jgi:phospholipase A1
VPLLIHCISYLIFLSEFMMKTNLRSLILTSLFVAPVMAQAAAQATAEAAAEATESAAASALGQDLSRCSVIGDASARLGCFDALAKMPPAATPTATQAETKAEARIDTASPATANAAPPESPISRTVQQWELDTPSKRGLFTFRPHRDNYLLLANYSNASNDAPFAEFNPDGIESQRVELTYQLSFKMKFAEEIAGSPVDLWFGYTQQSFWQAYNRDASSPFRETNYQPELMAVLPLHANFAGLDLRYINFGLVHQSNGQTGTLSRSWNRVYTELGVDRGNFSLAARVWHRLDNGKSNDDNPDIGDFMGNGDVRAIFRENGHEYSVTARHNFRTGHGALQAGWAFPLSRNLKGYLQAFSGYGQSLVDYNYAHKSLGAGFMVDL